MIHLGELHLTSAILSLAAGGWMLSQPKGTAIHRRTGWVYVASMVSMNATALLIYRLTGRFGPFHVLALISLGILSAGIIPAALRRPARGWLERHYFLPRTRTSALRPQGSRRRRRASLGLAPSMAVQPPSSGSRSLSQR